jgi:DNA-binding GntR family transcriptional regulator
LSDAYIAASYSAIRPYLSELTGSIAGTAERMFGIQVRNIVEELEPIVHDAETAAVFGAAVGSPAMLVRRWYFLGGETILIISRSIYPKGRAVEFEWLGVAIRAAGSARSRKKSDMPGCTKTPRVRLPITGSQQ